MNELTQRLLELHRKRERLMERKAELRSLVAYPKAVEYKAAVVQTSNPGGSELLEYLIRAEEIDAMIEGIDEEIGRIRSRIATHFGKLTERERLVVELRFFRFERWPIIAREIYGEITKDNISKAMKIKRQAERKLDTLLQ